MAATTATPASRARRPRSTPTPLEPIGFLATTVAFLAATLYLFGERNPLALAGYSLGFAIGVWLVFVQWLMIPL
uniref:tripartite tricarboxylate transporter TctB family protein n=1 Tax=Natronococcus amylolyticus TaxID=44470 RepID=UPI001F4CF380|nr:tripartite tricarboxylate transporter TctB family protein [Natronococcus amylolyticus]